MNTDYDIWHKSGSIYTKANEVGKYTGSKAARVTVYGPRGADDIGEYTGFTMISNLL